MSAKLLDADTILSENEQWTKLDRLWGDPVDLETEDDFGPSKLSPVFSTLDLRKTTFDSSFLFKKVRRKLGRSLSKHSMASNLDYKEFLRDLKDEDPENLPLKQFYFISGQILSALSVEDICDKIDDIFKSVEKLCSATSTVRNKRKVPKLPDVIQCSISATDLSFDDTVEDLEKEKNDYDDIDRYIDEAFDQLNSTMASLSGPNAEETSRDSVTTLVRKFSSLLNNPSVNCSPRRQKHCNDKFKELREFWKSRALEISN